MPGRRVSAFRSLSSSVVRAAKAGSSSCSRGVGLALGLDCARAAANLVVVYIDGTCLNRDRCEVALTSMSLMPSEQTIALFLVQTAMKELLTVPHSVASRRNVRVLDLSTRCSVAELLWISFRQA